MYHMKLNEQEIKFLDMVVQSFDQPEEKRQTTNFVCVNKFFTRHITRIRYNTAENRMARIRKDFGLYGNESYGIILSLEQYGSSLTIGSTNAPDKLIACMKGFTGIDLQTWMPDESMSAERKLLLAIENAMFSDHRKLMIENNITIDYFPVYRETLPFVFFSISSAWDFAQWYQKKTGLKTYVVSWGNQLYKDDAAKLAEILNKTNFAKK